ncbi:hypothetical protein OM513_03375 [Sphingomonas canadensis]|nr:hypothetical protein [Sphingomonas canadensis]MCW3835074.1 hypothetical protein [Sphingomonas canadensis]
MLMYFLAAGAAWGPAVAPPTCPVPSHDVLRVQPGRDVCTAPRDAQGRPRAAGFLPTQCERAGAEYRIDARGQDDLCVGE